MCPHVYFSAGKLEVENHKMEKLRTQYFIRHDSFQTKLYDFCSTTCCNTEVHVNSNFKRHFCSLPSPLRYCETSFRSFLTYVIPCSHIHFQISTNILIPRRITTIC